MSAIAVEDACPSRLGEIITVEGIPAYDKARQRNGGPWMYRCDVCDAVFPMSRVHRYVDDTAGRLWVVPRHKRFEVG